MSPECHLRSLILKFEIEKNIEYLKRTKKNKKMNFLEYKDVIEVGDIVIIYISPENLVPMTILVDGINQTKFGIFGFLKLTKKLEKQKNTKKIKKKQLKRPRF